MVTNWFYENVMVLNSKKCRFICTGKDLENETFTFEGACQACHIKSFIHGHLPESQKYFLIYHMNFDYCLQTKEKKKQIKQHSTMMNNYFLVLDYLEFWHNLMIVSMFQIVDKWGTFEIVNPKHYD